jgi:hypothetical protein
MKHKRYAITFAVDVEYDEACEDRMWILVRDLVPEHTDRSSWSNAGVVRAKYVDDRSLVKIEEIK